LNSIPYFANSETTMIFANWTRSTTAVCW